MKKSQSTETTSVNRNGEVNPRLPNGVNSLTYPCPDCGESVTSSRFGTTLLGGNRFGLHDHNPNCRTFHFTCSKDHCFTVRPTNTCPAPDCTWEFKADCFCHPAGAKVITYE